MPLNSDPNATVPVWLASDEKTPADKRPTWHARFITARQSNKIAAMWDQHDAAESLDKKLDTVDAILAIAIARHERWKAEGVDVPQGAKPSEHLTREELYELAGEVLRKPRLTSEEGKHSALPQASDGARTVTPAKVDAITTLPAVTQP